MRFFFILAILCGTLLLPAEEPGQQEYRLGLNLFEGLNGSVQDREAAFPFFKQAAARGNADAQYRLGHCYEFGFGTPKEPAKAREAYEQAAKQGHTEALFRLGNCHYVGLGTPQDYARALECFRKAAEQGNADALMSVGF